MKIEYDMGEYKMMNEYEIKIRVIENSDGSRAFFIDSGKVSGVETESILEDFIKKYSARKNPPFTKEQLRYMTPTLPTPPPTRKLCSCAPLFQKCEHCEKKN